MKPLEPTPWLIVLSLVCCVAFGTGFGTAFSLAILSLLGGDAVLIEITLRVLLAAVGAIGSTLLCWLFVRRVIFGGKL